MIIAHLADLHLGYRAYTRTTASGVNQREADVGAAASRAFAGVAAVNPDLVVIAGDVFHSVRPSNGAIADAFRTLSRLAVDLKGRPIVIAAGDRDTPRSSDTASILDLFREIPGVCVATDRIERFNFPGSGLEVVAAPHAALMAGELPVPAPRLAGRVAVLVAHATIRGTLPVDPEVSQTAAVVELETLLSGGWDYVALGHHPLPLEVAPAIAYSGSLERTGGDPWDGGSATRGFFVFDTESRTAVLNPVENRPVVELPRIAAAGRSVEEISAAIRGIAEDAGSALDGAIVRLVITDLTRQGVRELDPEPLREIRSRALHFVLDPRPPKHAAAAVRIRGISLEQQVEEFLSGGWPVSMEGIDRERLLAMGRAYLREAVEGSR